MSRQRPDPHEMGPQGPLLDLLDRPLARPADPYTSHEAAVHMKGSERLRLLQAVALDMVQKNPGEIANKLSRLAGSEDSRKIPRRLRELERAGLIKAEGTDVDPVTGRRGVRWWPVNSR